ncbi:MAG: helix-turn-helix domain-containing protein [Pirellulales bacterium]
MARKFLTLEEAATMLGVTVDTLAELRDRREVHGYRDGASWKFKEEDIERLKADRESIADEGEFAELDEDPDSILLSEVELGQSGESTSSTIIGGKSSPKDPLEDDIQIARPKHDSDVLDDALGAGSDAGGSGVLEAGSGVSPMFDDLDNLDLEMPSAADSGISTKLPEAGGSSPVLSAGDDDAFELSGDSAIGVDDGALKVGSDAGTSDIMLSGESLELEGSGLSFGDDRDLALGEDPGLEIESSQSGGSDIDLTGEFDDDLVLGGSSHGDLSRTGDSGISLLDPADSGISLEAPPLELGGSSVEQLELGEDDDLLMAEGSDAGAAAASGIGTADSDDDFLLSPLEEGAAEESDSGSQVIALESEVEFEDAGVATFEEEPAGGGLLEDDLGEGFGAAAALDVAGPSALGGRTPAGAPAGAGAAAMVPDMPFSGWNVMSLVLCAVLLLFCGMFAYDLLRNMWSWDAPYSVNSSMMEMILSWFE